MVNCQWSMAEAIYSLEWEFQIETSKEQLIETGSKD
jgi:hypothetical protein